MRPILWLVAMLLCSTAIAQNYVCDLQLVGRVIDTHDESALAFATVQVVDANAQVVADASGRFVITGLCPGTYRLKIDHVGCATVYETVRVREGTQSPFVFRLEHHYELRQLEVAAEAVDLSQDGTTLRVTEDALDFARTNGIGEIAASIGGVTTLKSGPNISKPQIHGVTGNRISIYQEGLQLEDQQWGDEHAPAIATGDIGNLIVVRGADGIEYGTEAIGGAIVALPPAFESNSVFAGDVRLAGSSNGRGGLATAVFSGALTANKRLRYRVTGGWQRFGDRQSANYTLRNTGDNHQFGSGALHYEFKTLRLTVSQRWVNQQYGILRDAHVGNLTDLELALARPSPLASGPFSYDIINPRQQVRHATTQFEGAFKPLKSGQLEWIYGYQRNGRREFDIRRGPYNDLPAVDLFLQTHDAVIKYTHVLSSNINVRIGVEGEWQQNLSDPETGTRAIVPNFKRQRYGGFVRFKWHPGTWQTSLGVRLDKTVFKAFKWYRLSVWEDLTNNQFDQFISGYNDTGNQVFTEPELRFLNLSAVIGVDRQWSDTWEAGIRLSLSSRPPNSAELFSDGVHLSAATVEYGDLALENEQAVSFSLHTSLERERLSLSASGVLRYFSGYIQPELAGLEVTVRGAFPQLIYNQVDAIFVGTEWQLTYGLRSDLDFKHAGSTLYGHDVDRTAPLPAIAPTQFSNGLDWHKPLNNGVEITCSLGVTSVLEKRYAPRAIAPEALSELSDDALTAERENGAFDIAPPPGQFHLVNASVKTDIPWGAKSLSVALVADNLLNRPYRNYLNRFRYYADDTGINVQLFIHLKF